MKFLLSSRFKQYFPNGKSTLLNDLSHLRKTLENSENPVVFCHNDLLLANVLFTGKSVSFIDYEYAGYNYQAFDIANHFNEFAGTYEQIKSNTKNLEEKINFFTKFRDKLENFSYFYKRHLS